MFKYSFFFFLTMIAFALPSFAGIQTIDGAPEGFEQLEKPRQTSVNVYYGGDILGTFPAHFAPGTLQFDNPVSLIEAIPAIKDKNVVLNVLNTALPSHPELLCTEKKKEDCGTLIPEVTGVIFDENNLQAHLFINKKYLSIIPSQSDKYLPLPKRQLASVLAFSGAVNGTDSQKPNYSVTNNAVYSYGEMKFNTQTTAADQGVRFDTANASIDRNGKNGTVGLFRSRPMQLITDRDIAGLSVSTSMQTLRDGNKIEGNDIIVYLPRRSFVSIYREGRLYSSRAYDSGNQQIDTTELPEGAYTITLKIEEADGNVREEQRFFAKNQQIPPPNRPIYYAQAGVIRENASDDSTVPQLTSDPLARVGTVRRISDNLGLNVGVLGIKDRAMLESGLFWVKQNTQVQASALASSKGDTGVQFGYQQLMGKFNLNLDARDMWATSKPIPGYDEISDHSTQFTAVGSYTVTPTVTVGFRGSYSKQTNMDVVASIGPYAEWRIWQKNEDMLSINADAAHTQMQNQGSILLHYTHRFGKSGITSTGGVIKDGKNTGPTGDTRIWHDNETPGNSIRTSAGLTGDKSRRTVNGDADWDNRFGIFHGGVQKYFGDSGSNLSYGGNFAFNAAQVADEFHIGGDQNEKSAIIIDTKGDGNTKMKILVNGAPRSTVQLGDQQVIYLAPFNTYNVRLAPEHSSMLDYDSADRKVTLYPGNVVKLTWKVSKFYVVSAHIVSEDRMPVKNAILQQSKNQVVTNEKGYLQAEMGKLDIMTFKMENGENCLVSLPDDVIPINGVLLYKNDIVCKQVSQNAVH